MTMDAQTYHDLQATVERLRGRLLHHQFTDKRKGQVPPAAMFEVVEDVRDALATMDALWAQASAVAYVAVQSAPGREVSA